MRCIPGVVVVLRLAMAGFYELYWNRYVIVIVWSRLDYATTLWEKSLWSNNTKQFPHSGLEPGPLDPESSALTMRPSRLHKTNAKRFKYSWRFRESLFQRFPVLKSPYFRVSLFWRFPILVFPALESPYFRDSPFQRVPILEFPYFGDSTF